MNNRVYTYTKITELKNAPFFTEIAALPQITMSLDMARSMAYDMRIFKNNIYGFSAFLQRLIPGWNTGAQRFTYITLLNRHIREKIARSENAAEKEWLFGCKKNLSSAIHNIIRLEEARIRPEYLDASDRDLLLFLEMWKNVIREDPTIIDFRTRLAELRNRENFDRAVNTIFKFHGRKQIVLHGFQFFTPIQQFIYDCFIHAGYEVLALIQCEVRYPYANEIWTSMYSQNSDFPSMEHWIRQADSSEKNVLGEIFEKGETISAPNLKLIKYKNTVEFIEDIPRIKKDGYYMYCADDHCANKMLKDYFPEKYEVRNLLAYPIGQFIFTLHKMWDENLQCIVLEPDSLRKCFASGWLSAKGSSSMNYTEDLERLLPYFEGCHTVEQWNRRLGIFTEAYNEAIDVFTIASASSEDIFEKHKKEVLGNPFRQFGVFSIREERIEDVLTIIHQLITMAKKLFGANEPISIQEHMNRLDELLYMNDGMPQDLYLEEKKKVKQIFAALESDKIQDFLCYPGDVSAAMLAFMNGTLEENETDKNDLQTLVFNIYQIEAAPLSAKGKVHICLADIGKLPGTSGNYFWPVDEELLTEIEAKQKDTYVKNWIDSMHNTALANRYYIYNALKNPDVEISWIQQQGGKLLSPSPYLTLLDRLTDAKITENSVRNLTLASIAKIPAYKKLDTNFDIRTNMSLHNPDSEMEYALCPMRFVYSHVLGDRSAYQNEYQQNRAIVKFIQVLHKLLGEKYSFEQIAAQVFELFPGIRKAEKRQLLDYAMQWNLQKPDMEYTTFDGINYTNYRLELLFTDRAVYESAKKHFSALMSQEGRRGIFHNRSGEEHSHNCEFCPHEAYCGKSLFGVDYKGNAND